MEKFEINEEGIIDVKRFYFPLIINLKCPHCQSEVTRDFSDHYLSYPKLNKKITEGFYCKSCDKEFEADMFLRISIDVDSDNLRKI